MASDETPTVNIRPGGTGGDEPVLVEVEDVPLAGDDTRYELLAELGTGGMGEVLLWKDTRISRRVAAKVLRHALRDNPDYRSRFLLEARLQGQLEHPSIVPVHDLGVTASGDLYFTMKRVRGITLRDALRTGAATRFSTASGHGEHGRPRLSRRRLISAFSNVCLAVDFAHRHGVVHRDLKPENIMLGDFGEVYVLDWGIAKVMHHAERTAADEEATVAEVDLSGAQETPTRIGTVLGTPHYMAPERRFGRSDARTDIYALGVILREILDHDRHVEAPELVRVVELATADDPESRFASARQLHDELEAYLDGDRDLEMRRKLAEQHARDAEHALERSRTVATADERTRAARDVGRALGMDPSNGRALRTLVRLLTEMPNELPPEAAAEIDRRWQERRRTMFRRGSVTSGSLLILVPFFVWMGVLDWPMVIAFTTLVVAGSLLQARAGSSASHPWTVGIAMALKMLALALMSRSMGLLGVLPAALAVLVLAYRINFDRWTQGVAILAVAVGALMGPLVLEWTGAISPSYGFANGTITLVPDMHAFPPSATIAYLVFSCFGVIAISLLYGRAYVNELRRVDRELAFHVWQLQQTLPGDMRAP